MKLPRRPRLERGVLATLLLDPGRLSEVQLRPGDLTLGPLEVLYAWMVDRSIQQKPYDLQTLLALTAEGASPPGAPGISELAALPMEDATGGPTLLTGWVKQIRELADRRRAMLAHRRALEALEAGDLVGHAAALAEASAGLGEAQGGRKWLLGTHVGDVAERLVARCRRAPEAQSRTPWPGGNRDAPPAHGPRPGRGELLLSGTMPVWQRTWELLGPWFPDRLAVLVGGTGRGKSAMAVQIAEAAAHAKTPVLYVSAEMSAEEVLARLLALRSIGGVSYVSILQGRVDPVELQTACEILLGDCPYLYLWAPDRAGRTSDAILAATRELVEVCAGAAPLVVVDYLQRLSGAEGADRRIQVGDLSGSLRDLARPGGLHSTWPGASVLVLSSVSRTHYANFSSVSALREAAKGTLEGSGKESGEIEYDAPLVLAMTSDPDPYRNGFDGAPAERRALLAVAKNRHGEARGLVPFRFQARCGRFWEVSAGEEASWWPKVPVAKGGHPSVG